MFKFVIAFILVLMAQAQAPTVSITAVPSAATTNQIVTLVAGGDVSLNSRWSLSGGEWCQFRSCFWRTDYDLSAGPNQNPLWRATEAGDYTITLTPPTGSAATATITVTDP